MTYLGYMAQCSDGVHFNKFLRKKNVPCGLMDYLETSEDLRKTAGFRIFFINKKTFEKIRKPAGNLRDPFPGFSRRFPDNPSLTDHTVCAF